MDAHHQDLVAQFSAVTGANPSVAQTALEATNWDLEQSMALFYDEQAQAPAGDADEGVAAAAGQAHAPEGAGSQAAAASSRGASSRSRPQQMSFRDLQREKEEPDDDDARGQDMFAGGEKSGLAVQNPGERPNHFQSIINQARQNRDRPPAMDEDEEPSRPSHFTGRAQTLGGDDVPSRIVEEPGSAGRAGRAALPRVTRTLHLWQDGVSVDDGPLFRFDDPNNAHILQEISQGRAPRSLLDIAPDQEVDLNLDAHKDQTYVAPKKKYKPFGGQGQRLGSPTPGFSSLASAAAAPASAPAASVPDTSASRAPEMTVDPSQPTLQMQIRLGDGTRLVSRFNTAHTIGDVYQFVDRASTASQSRPYVLQTTFPPTEFTDRAKVLGEIPDFKRGGVLVQKWK